MSCSVVELFVYLLVRVYVTMGRDRERDVEANKSIKLYGALNIPLCMGGTNNMKGKRSVLVGRSEGRKVG